MNNLSEFVKPFSKLCLAFNQTTNEGQMLIYFDFLKKFPLDRIEEAVSSIILTNKFFPKVAELIELLSPVISIEAQAEEAWNEACESAECAGRLPIKEKTAQALNAVGGMMALRDYNLDDIHFLRKDFIEAYKNLRYIDRETTECFGLTGGVVKEIGGGENGSIKRIAENNAA